MRTSDLKKHDGFDFVASNWEHRANQIANEAFKMAVPLKVKVGHVKTSVSSLATKAFIYLSRN